MEHDHPHALEFLRKDLWNVTEFFRRQQVAGCTVVRFCTINILWFQSDERLKCISAWQVAVLGLRELFDWVVDTEPDWQERLDRLSELAATRTEEERSAQQAVDEEVFKQVTELNCRST